MVGADNRVTLRPITVASTDGKVLRVAAGLNEGEKVVLNLPTTVADGGKVNPAPAPGAPAAPAPPPSQSAKGTVSQQPPAAPAKQQLARRCLLTSQIVHRKGAKTQRLRKEGPDPGAYFAGSSLQSLRLCGHRHRFRQSSHASRASRTPMNCQRAQG